jgi:putative FmdB family regulatory protein
VPTYQYVCTDCASDLEAVQSFSEPSLTVCPTCGGKLRKKFGAVGVVFKGSGFYRNDSREAASSTTPAVKSESGSGESTSKSDKPSSDGGKSGDSGTGSASGSGSNSGSGSGSGSGDKPAAKSSDKSSASPVAG